jgi:hypothetical protein
MATVSALRHLLHPDSKWKGGELTPDALLAWTQLREQMSRNANISLPDNHLPYCLAIQIFQSRDQKPLCCTTTLTQNDSQDLQLLLA